MPHKPDHYHQTNPPCELKKDVMGRQGSKKGQKESTPSGSASGATPCSLSTAFRKIAIRGDNFAGWEVVAKYPFWPWWVQLGGCNTHRSEELAMAYAKRYATLKIL